MQKSLVYYHSENRATSQIWKVLPNMVFSPDLGGKNGGVLSMRMQVILDSSFARPGSAPIWGGKKVELRDWTTDPKEVTRSEHNPQDVHFFCISQFKKKSRDQDHFSVLLCLFIIHLPQTVSLSTCSQVYAFY